MSETTFTPLPDISADSPAGDNLELESDFVAMERASEGTPETQYGNTINPAVPPDWKEVQSLALGLLERTRDLRVLVHLAVARLNLTGIPDFAETIAQIRYLIENRWEQVHPRLDPEDDNDPILRLNTLARLQTYGSVLSRLREMPLARSPRAGIITYKEIAICLNQMQPDAGTERPTDAFIRGGFSDSDREQGEALRAGLDRVVSETEALSAAVYKACGQFVDLPNLTKMLGELKAWVTSFAPPDDAAPETLTAEGESGSSEGAGGGEVRGGSGGATFARITARSLTNVSQRDDALYLMQLAADYFKNHEPSSPVPLLLERAARLASMGFFEILRDMAPNGIDQAQNVAGSAQT